ncbi:MAG: hypothetical protein GYB66_08020 [Chloroflexi bacterium]|nr:hypothetical protein [Chloroflexota bacterium]
MAQRHRRLTDLLLTHPSSPLLFVLALLVLVLAILLSGTANSLVRARPHADGGGTIDVNETVQGELQPGETDVWTFWGQADQRLSLAVEKSPPDADSVLDPYLTLVDPDGEIVGEDDNSGVQRDAALLGIRLTRDGLYAARVSSVGESRGSYTLSLAENFLPGECEAIQGTIITREWYSPIANESLAYRVYLPPCYAETPRRYPYIVLMHGSTSSDTHWDNLGVDEAVTTGVALNRLPPVAIVMPYGGEIANLNIFYRDGSYEYVILNEVMPAVEEDFCLQTSGSGRAIGGISRGGFWAYEIGLRHPEQFTAIGGHSPVFDLYHAPETHNPLNLIENIEWADDYPRLYIDRGRDDYWQVNIDLMAPRLAANDIPATIVIRETGTHEDGYWAAHLHEYLAFYTADWTGGLATYPLCDITGRGLAPEDSEPVAE